MRVVFNSYQTFGAGGPQKYASLFQSELRKRAIDVVGLALVQQTHGARAMKPFWKHEEGGDRFIAHLNLESECVVRSARPGIPKIVRDVARKVTRILATLKPDQVVLNGFSLSNWYLAQAATNLRIPFHFSHHGCWFAEIPTTLPKAAQTRMLSMERWATEHADTNIYLNPWSQSQVRKAYPGARRTNDLIIPLPFNPLFLKRAPRLPIQKNKRPVVGFVGRWDPIKRVDFVRKLAERMPHIQFICHTHVGGRKSLMDEENRFSKAVHVLKPVSQTLLPAFYRACDLLILPSRFDVSPTVVMEAALQGRGTLISPEVGWTDAYAKNDMDTWIVRKTDLATWQHAIEQHLKKKPGPAFRTHLLKAHHPKTVFDAWASLIS